nr:extracellular solute-binding protein [Actinopolymorpha pittospori]
MERRRLLAAAAMSAAGIALAGCTRSNSGGGGGGSSGGSGQQEAPKGPFRASATPDAPPVPDNPIAQSTGGTVPGPPGYSLPLTDRPVTFTFAAPDNGYAPRSYTQNLAVWQEIEKRTGVRITWDVAPSAQYSDAMAPRLGSGRNLPDLVSLPQGWDPVRAGAEKLVVPLNKYLNEQNTPNIMKLFADFPDVKKLISAPGGEIYALPSVVTDAAYSDPFGLMIRQDWLDKLDLAEPTSLDEWHRVLTAFLTKDPNGNGKQDEVPLTIGTGPEAAYLFGNALGLHLFYGGGWYVTDDHRVYYEWTDDRLKELLTWLNRLYKEKLLDPQFYQTEREAVLRKVTRDLSGASIDFSNHTLEYNKAQAAAGQQNAHWVMAKPPTSDQVSQPYYEGYGPLSGWFSVTRECENPQLAARWLDYVWASDEGNTLVSYGVEGLTYTVGADRRLEFTTWVTDNPQELDPQAALRYHGAMPYASPWIRAAKGPLSEFQWDVTRTDENWLASAEKIAPSMVLAYPTILATPEETKELTGILPDLETYRDESILKFILGQQPLDDGNWQEYVSTINGMGLDRVVEIQQQQYDRFTGRK